ncbi:MAG: GDSL-type esterase/lipase family protein [Gammaproteobacteria bacterium]
MSVDRRGFLMATLATGGALVGAAPGIAAAPAPGTATATPERVVLCFGDSNTWGFVPRLEPGGTRFTRYGVAERWPRLLEASLGQGVRVVEHGICGLVGALPSGAARFEDGASRAAIDHVRGLIAANWPIDDWVVMLGTNDLAYPELGEPSRIADGIAELIEAGLSSHAWFGGPAPRVTLVSPIPLGPAVTSLGVAEEGIARSEGLAREFAARARAKGWRSLDAGRAGALDTADGVHWSPAHQQRFAGLLAKTLAEPVPA